MSGHNPFPRRALLRATAAFAALPLGAALPALAADPILRIAYPDKSPPNSWVEPGGGMRGILVDLMAAVAEEAGLGFSALPLPLPRVQAAVESGTADGMCLVATPARLKYAIASAEPLTTGRVTLFVRKGSPAAAKLKDVQSLDELAATGVTVIAIEGNGWIRENVERRGMHTVFANGTVGTVRMLIGGRGDVIADMSHQINWITKEIEGGGDVEEIPAVMDKVDWHLLLSKKSALAETWKPKLDAAIHRLKTSGAFDAVFAGYGVKV